MRSTISFSSPIFLLFRETADRVLQLFGIRRRARENREVHRFGRLELHQLFRTRGPQHIHLRGIRQRQTLRYCILQQLVDVDRLASFVQVERELRVLRELLGGEDHFGRFGAGVIRRGDDRFGAHAASLSPASCTSSGPVPLSLSCHSRITRVAAARTFRVGRGEHFSQQRFVDNAEG